MAEIWGKFLAGRQTPLRSFFLAVFTQAREEFAALKGTLDSNQFAAYGKC